MKQLLTINLTTRTADWTPPTFTFGESLTLAIRFQKSVNGNLVEPNLSITGAKASVGLVDARPGGGTFKLQFDADPTRTTAELTHDCTAAQLAAAINALPAVVTAHGTAVVKKVNGSWLIRFGTGAAEVNFQVADNALWPISFGVISAGQREDNLWLHELRLTQAPVAFVGGAPDLRLPTLPSFSVEIHGGSSGSGQVWDTVQQLYIPPDFRGTYRIVKNFQRTALIDEGAGADTIQAALIAAFGSTFTVTLPFSYRFNVDLGGDFAGLDVPQMDIEGGQAPAHDLYLTIPFDRLELAAMLRSQASVTLPLEIRIVCTEDGDDPQEIVALNVPITINRPIALPIMDTLQTINWLRYPTPKTYLGPGSGVNLTGEKIFATTVGNGALTTFAIGHPLDSADVWVGVKLNNSPGTQLIDGTDFTATIDDAHNVTVTALTGAPATDAWRIMIVAAKEITSWAPDLHIAQNQVDGLESRLDGDEANIATLMALIPGTAIVPNGLAPANGYTIQLPPVSEILFARDASGAAITDPAKLPARPPFMLPAINRTSGTDGTLASPLPSPSAGALYATAVPTLIPGGGHIRSSTAPAPGFVGSDGRMLYPVTQSGTKNSWFPTPFERVLFEIMVNDRQFSPGTVLTCLFKLALQLINANTEAQWMLAIEQGLIYSDETDPTYDTSLFSVDWQTNTPILLQKLNLSSALETHGFGCTIANTASTTFAGNALAYKTTTIATANIQQTANFALRARLFNFDTKNSVTDARGWVSWALQAPDNGNTLGVVIA